MASVVYGVASKLQAIANDVLPASMVQQAQSLDAFIETSYGVQYGTVLIVLVLVVLAIPLLLAPLFSGGNHRTQSKGRNCILMIGPSDAGKTVMFHQLLGGRNVETVTSMKPGVLHYQSTQGPIEMIDFPGHQRLQGHLRPLLKRAMKVVFVIDVSAMTNQLRPAAELLYDILTDPSMDNGPAILIACNKSDVSTARQPARVKIMLQQEIEKVRKTRETLSRGEEEEGEGRLVLGTAGQVFSFERDSPCEVTFAATSATTGALDAVKDFIET